jgi:RNA polymerase sigma-70 factor (ECF subfamily)
MMADAEEGRKNSGIAEKELLHQAGDGDAGAFEQLYRRYSRQVFCLSLRVLKNETEAEDLTREAFLQAFRKIHTFREESSFFTWLYRWSVSALSMRVRERKPTEIQLENFGEDEDARSAARHGN